ncbi:MAG: transglycosylase domain-containing protein [Flavonifractor plautii]
MEHLSLHGTENRQLVDFEEIPDNLINATVAIEDETFWKHHGVNWKRTLKGCRSCSPAAIFRAAPPSPSSSSRMPPSTTM